MASIINASTSSGIVQTADTSGILKLQTAGTDAVTVSASQVVTLANPLPVASGGTGLTSGGPAFSAYQSASSQSLTGGVSTKVTFDAETFDTNNNFASSRFTPTVAGYYLLTSIVFLSSSAQEVVITFQKNGSQLTCGTDVTTNTYNSASTVIAYANGTTDYFEVYCYSSVNRSISNVATNTYFNGCLLRAA